MTRLFCQLWLLAALSAAPPSARGADAIPPLPSTPVPGRYMLTVNSGGFDREAQVHVPAGYKSDMKPPLVVILHGAGGSGVSMLDNYGWARKADSEGFVAVAPDGLPPSAQNAANFFKNPRLWNSGQLKAGTPRSAIDDVAFIRQLLDALQEKVPCDKGRVFCTGHSNGGAMTFRLASELSDRFTAVGMVAGTLNLSDPHPQRPLPTLYIIGTKDPLVPIDGGEVKLPWGTRQSPPVAKGLAVWSHALGCEREPKTLSDADDVRRVVYPAKAGGPALTVLYLNGHGHHWPGGKSLLPESMIGPSTSMLDATDTLWDFFKANGPRTNP